MHTEQAKLKTYDKIYSKVCSKIRHTNTKYKAFATYYEMPSFSYGLPCYNKMECSLYIKYKLQTEGFDVVIYSPQNSYFREYTLYIDWQLSDQRKKFVPVLIQPSKPIEAIKAPVEPYSYLGYGNNKRSDEFLETSCEQSTAIVPHRDVSLTVQSEFDEESLNMLANKKYVLKAFDHLK